jgi:polyisoprenyl-teichoic acid--peptidoglycan teichoic acid transferase
MADAGQKPYRLYRGGRAKGSVPLERVERETRRSARADGGGPGKIVERAPRRRRWSWKRWVPILIVALVLLFAIWGAVGYVSVSRGVDSAHGRLPAGTAATLNSDSGLLMSTPTDILLLGTDHSNDGQPGRSSDDHSDSMMLLRTDPGRHRLIYLSIPRDLRASIPGAGDQKINAAMQIGGPPLAVRTVEAYTGLPINHVVVVDFGSFEKLIDAVGGIDVNVPENILSNRFDCPFTAAKCSSWPGWRFHKGVQHMDGHRALIYSRIRENQLNPADTDISRGEHQQQVMQATLSKLASASTFFKLPFDGSSLLAPIATDLSTWDFMQLGWVKFRASAGNTLHCRLGGTGEDIGGGSYIVGGPENIQVIQEVLGHSAPQPPSPSGGLYAPGCLVGSTSAG